jgi:tRNA dimethylallyltransferase
MALALAEREGGIVINADSMQVYSVLDVLTARPGASDQRRARHLLYGHVDPAVSYSTGAWLRDVSRLAGEGQLDRRPIFVGGTGLYFRALVEGLSDMPDIPEEVRTRWRSRLEAEGAQALHRVLAESDPAAAGTLRQNDGQRIVRALEVLEVSGRSIKVLQAGRGVPLVDRTSARLMVLEPPRPVLVERIDKRLQAMAKSGALDEVRTLAGLHLDPKLPVMKAIGVREFAMAIRGEITLDEAVALAATATRQYAKRQSTWFRHQLGPEWERHQTSFP